MKQIDKIKRDISSITSAVEMAGFLDGVRSSAAIYCKNNLPDEINIKNGQLEDITIYGLSCFLDSNAE